MSSSHTLCCLPLVKKQKQDFQVCFVHFYCRDNFYFITIIIFFFVQCIIKQLFDLVFVISRIIKV